jgi:NADPH:quinone reductase-like Zn-dependent oxidoreductase
MALPKTYRAFRRRPGNLPGAIELTTEDGPKSLAPTEVLLKIQAVSINYRDVAMLHGTYPVDSIKRGIAASDCAAEVVASGSDVDDFGKGDHVSVIFNLAMIKGDEDEGSNALGGECDGVLREYAVFDQKYLVQLPRSMGWTEVCNVLFMFFSAINIVCSLLTFMSLADRHPHSPVPASPPGRL